MATSDLDEYCKNLVKWLRRERLDEVAEMPEVKDRADRASSLIEAGLQRFRKASRLDPDDIVVSDVDARDVTISRYAPFYYFRNASYSVGISRHSKGASIRAMANPWRDFPSVHLGEIFRKLGGGGHQRVGALIIPEDRVAEAGGILDRVLSMIRKERESGASDTEL